MEAFLSFFKYLPLGV